METKQSASTQRCAARWKDFQSVLQHGPFPVKCTGHCQQVLSFILTLLKHVLGAALDCFGTGQACVLQRLTSQTDACSHNSSLQILWFLSQSFGKSTD